VANISLKKICKQFNEASVIRDLDLEVEDGEFLVLVGPSGCGKSTTLRLIAGLESITTGELRIDGELMNDVSPSKRGAAMVFQSYALYPHMTVEENMGFGLRMGGMSKSEVSAQVLRTAETLQMMPLLKRYPKQLSGGQRQRVAIGRAIVRRPKVFLFDEPLSNLDAALRVQMRIELAKMHKELKTTIVYVTHDQTEAMTLGDRIAVFNQGKIEQLGTPLELYQKPSNTFVAEFLGSPKINLLPCQFDAASASLVLAAGVRMPLAVFGIDAAQAQQVRQIGVRPEHWTTAAAGNGMTARIDFMENLGDSVVMYVSSAFSDKLLTVKIDQLSVSHRLNDDIHLNFRPELAVLFNEAGQRVQ
jgi:multiple sugar transport system ATP-binding protein